MLPALAPSLDVTRVAEGTLHAEDFRLSALQPFLRDALGKVDGLLDADLS